MPGQKKAAPGRPAKKQRSQAKRQSSPKPSPKRNPKPSPLPDAIDVPQPQGQQPEPQSSLLSHVQNLFQRPREPIPSQPDSFENSSTSERLSEESERILDSIPARIGGEADDPGGPADNGDGGDQDPISALMREVAFDREDVEAVLIELFDSLAERFESDHWRLKDRQVKILGKPTTQLLCSVWAKLCAIMPDVVARWCENTPGAMAFLIAAGIVVVPKARKQMALNRLKVTAKRPVPVQQPTPAKVSKSEVPKWAPAP